MPPPAFLLPYHVGEESSFRDQKGGGKHPSLQNQGRRRRRRHCSRKAPLSSPLRYFRRCGGGKRGRRGGEGREWTLAEFIGLAALFLPAAARANIQRSSSSSLPHRAKKKEERGQFLSNNHGEGGGIGEGGRPPECFLYWKKKKERKRETGGGGRLVV